MPTRVLVLMWGTLLALGTAVLAQQHSYTQADIDAGSRLYDSNCGSCHGERGDKIVGIDFSTGAFKTARTDDDLIRIIRSGVANTGMPPNPMSEVQANTIVAYLRSMPSGLRPTNSVASLSGDSGRGRMLFEGKGNCSGCHAINGVGGTTGPDLGLPSGARGARGAAAGAAPPVPGGERGGARGGARGRGGPPGGRGQAGPPRGGGGGGGAPGGRGAAPNPQQLERSILDPSAEMAAEYRIYQVVTRSNVTARGTLLNQDTFSVQMRDNADKLMSFWKQDLKEYGFLPSPMPSYRDTLTSQEVADIVSFLVSLRQDP